MSRSKASCIRAVARDADFGRSNKWIMDEVHRRFGVKVLQSHIIEILGPFRERKHKGKLLKLELELASQFVKRVGCPKKAVRLINLLNDQSLAA